MCQVSGAGLLTPMGDADLVLGCVCSEQERYQAPWLAAQGGMPRQPGTHLPEVHGFLMTEAHLGVVSMLHSQGEGGLHLVLSIACWQRLLDRDNKFLEGSFTYPSCLLVLYPGG